MNLNKEKILGVMSPSEYLYTNESIPNQIETNPKRNLGFTFAELLQLEIPQREEIICGLGRGEIGLLNAVNNVGKTTLLRNIMISLCLGQEFEPLTRSKLKRRIAFLDFEDTLSFLRQDLLAMTSNLSEAELEIFSHNSFLSCDFRDEEDADLSLSNKAHRQLLTEKLKVFKPDLIIVDTISSAFNVENENDNSKVKDSIMRPLKRLAVDCNAALIASHHIGKQKSEEGQTREASHKGRGASVFADSSRVVFNLERDTIGDNVMLSCAKLKGRKFDDTLFRYDSDSRWFSKQGIHKELSKYEMLLEMFADGKKYTTKEVIAEFENISSPATIKRLLGEAIKRCDLRKASHGSYQKP